MKSLQTYHMVSSSAFDEGFDLKACHDICQSVSQECDLMKETESVRISEIVRYCTPHYYPDVDPTDPFLEVELPDFNGDSRDKQGYVYLRRGAVKHEWQRSFIRVENGFMFLVESKREKVIMQLRDARCMPVALDDRRYVFVVHAAIGKTRVSLQAESERSMEVSY